MEVVNIREPTSPQPVPHDAFTSPFDDTEEAFAPLHIDEEGGGEAEDHPISDISESPTSDVEAKEEYITAAQAFGHLTLKDSLVVHRSRLEVDKALALITEMPRVCPINKATRDAAAADTLDLKIHKSELEKAKEEALKNEMPRVSPRTLAERTMPKYDPLVLTLKIHQSQLEKDQEEMKGNAMPRKAPMTRGEKITRDAEPLLLKVHKSQLEKDQEDVVNQYGAARVAPRANQYTGPSLESSLGEMKVRRSRLELEKEAAAAAGAAAAAEAMNNNNKGGVFGLFGGNGKKEASSSCLSSSSQSAVSGTKSRLQREREAAALMEAERLRKEGDVVENARKLEQEKAAAQKKIQEEKMKEAAVQAVAVAIAPPPQQKEAEAEDVVQGHPVSDTEHDDDEVSLDGEVSAAVITPEDEEQEFHEEQHVEEEVVAEVAAVEVAAATVEVEEEEIADVDPEMIDAVVQDAAPPAAAGVADEQVTA
jgi:hypothetical protein